MMFEAGFINRRGTVEVKQRYLIITKLNVCTVAAFSLLLCILSAEYKINKIDNPVLYDFIVEVIASISVCVTAVMLLNAQHGVEVGTELLWSYVNKYRKPTLMLIAMIICLPTFLQVMITEVNGFESEIYLTNL